MRRVILLRADALGDRAPGLVKAGWLTAAVALLAQASERAQRIGLRPRSPR